jgi:hypothetical protein
MLDEAVDSLSDPKSITAMYVRNHRTCSCFLSRFTEREILSPLPLIAACLLLTMIRN